RFAVGDGVDVGVQAGEAVQRTARTHRAHAGDLIEQAMGEHGLFVVAATGADQFVDGLVATEGGLDGVLGGDVGAHAHIGHQRQAFDVVVGQVFRPGDAQPSGAVAAHAVGLGQPGEGQAQDVVAGVGSGVVVHGLL